MLLYYIYIMLMLSSLKKERRNSCGILLNACMHAGPFIFLVFYIILLTVFESKGGRYTHATRLRLLYTAYCHDKDMRLLHLFSSERGRHSFKSCLRFL